MSEKSFKDNPALQFISGAGEDMAESQRPDPQSHDGEGVNSHGHDGAGTETPPGGYKKDPHYIEKKTRRLQLILQPSLYKKVQREAKRQKLSVNEYVHRVLEEATEGK